LEKRLVISTLLGERVEIHDVYKGCKVQIGAYSFGVDVIPLKRQGFDVILGMEWLGMYHTPLDCYSKTVVLRMMDGKEIKLKGERNLVSNGLKSIMMAENMTRKGCKAYLAYVVDMKKKSMKLFDILVVM
jgi:hypothetical protein